MLLEDGKTRVTHPRGWVIPEIPPPSKLPDKPLAELELEGWEGKPRWGYERIDMNWALEEMWRPSVGEDEPPDS